MGLHGAARKTFRHAFRSAGKPYCEPTAVAWDAMTFLYEFRGKSGEDLLRHFWDPMLRALLRKTRHYALVFDSPNTPVEKKELQEKRRRAVGELACTDVCESRLPSPWLDALGTPCVRDRILAWVAARLREVLGGWLPDDRAVTLLACGEEWLCRPGAAAELIGTVPECAAEGDCGSFWWLQKQNAAVPLARSLDSDCFAIALIREHESAAGLKLRLANRSAPRFDPLDPIDTSEAADWFDLRLIAQSLRERRICVWNAVFVMAAQGTDYSPRLVRGVSCDKALAAALIGDRPTLADEPCLLASGSFDAARARRLLAASGRRCAVCASDGDLLRAAWVVEYWAGRPRTLRLTV